MRSSMADEWTEKPLSPSAIVDDEYLASVAKDLAANEWTPPPNTPALTKRDLDRALSRLSVTIGKAVAQMVVKPLQARIAELEQKQLTLGGVWREGQHYAERTLCQKDGGLWLSMAPTSAKPGNGSPAWKLVVKKGAAG